MRKKLFSICCLFSSCASMISGESTYAKLGDNNFYLVFWVIVGLSIIFEVFSRITENSYDTKTTDHFILMLIIVIAASKLTSLISDSLGNMFWVILMFSINAIVIGSLFAILLLKTRIETRHIKYLLYSIAAIDCCVWLFHCKI